MTMPTIEDLARVICETRNVPGFKCTCPLASEPEGNNWCNGNRAIWQARAVLDALKPVVAEAWMQGTAWDGQMKRSLIGSHAEPYAARIIAQLSDVTHA